MRCTSTLPNYFAIAQSKTFVREINTFTVIVPSRAVLSLSTYFFACDILKSKNTYEILDGVFQFNYSILTEGKISSALISW